MLSKQRQLTLRLSLLTTLLSLTSIGASQQASSDAAQRVVQTDKGAVQGTVNQDLRVFKGIPYAASPSGALRWELPQPRAPWTGTLDATQYKSGCPQVARYGLTEAGYNEDCLYLNITAPITKTTPQKKLPVVVWMYGGAFVGGSTALYPLEKLAREGQVLVVSMNYRLGVFGFMAHPNFDAAANGSLGLEDQRAALRWVQKNITAFGGDPDNVTIAGESAGAASVCMHLIAPEETKGLFQKAIIQSAGCVHPFKTVAENGKTGEKVAALVGCNDAAKALACMRAVPVKTLLEAGSKVAGADIMTFVPSIGSKAQPRQGREAFATGQIVRVPILNGGNRDELRLYVAYAIQAGDKITPENYLAHLEAVYGDKAAQVMREYPLSAYSSPATALGTATSDYSPLVALNNCDYLETANLGSAYTPVYQYEFADATAPEVTPNPGFEMGAVHSAELPYQFPGFSNTTKLDGPALSAPSQRLADQMMAYWTSFARTGTPQASLLPAWTPFKSANQVMRFAPDNVWNFDAGAAHHCAFWQGLYPDRLSLY
jgi:para-nitrobenzyl esterase